jgi:hypothetical protein
LNKTGEEIGTVDSNIVKRFGEYLKKSGYSVSGTVYPFISECIKEENGETAVIQLVDLSDTYGAGSEGISRESAGMEWIDPEMLKKQTENVNLHCIKKSLSSYYGGILYAGPQGQGSISEPVEFCGKYFENGRIYQTWSGF